MARGFNNFDIKEAAEVLGSGSPSGALAGMAKSYELMVDQLGVRAERAMFAAAHRGRTEAVMQIGKVVGNPLSEARFNPIDTGEMRRSYKVDKLPGEGAVLENVATHASHQEYGTRPFTPDRGKLEEWARRKVWSAPKKKKRRAGSTKVRKKKPGSKTVPKRVPGKLNRKLNASQTAEAKALAAKAFFSIRRRGIIPKRFHEAASQHFSTYVEQEVLKAWRRYKG